MDLFGLSGGADESFDGGIESIDLSDVLEYPKSDLMRMEREVTGLYLSGHPMDEYRNAVRSIGVVGIRDILADFAREDGNTKFKNDQQIVIAGVIESVKTKPTRNNTLMAYLTLDDGSGSIELLAFQRTIDESGGYMQVSAPVIASGRLSARDDKDPQIVLNTIRPITDIANAGCGIRDAESGRAAMPKPQWNIGSGKREVGYFTERHIENEDRTLFVKIQNESSAEYERLKLVHTMFPGRARMVIHFCDTNKSVGTKCVIHDALVSELRDMLGTENVIVR
jgi:DNA polymerase-3 subunit alpha